MVKALLHAIAVLLILSSCNKTKEIRPLPMVDLENRKALDIDLDSLCRGKTYLPVYSHIYHTKEHRTFDLTITVSIRNVSVSEDIYITKADYYNTGGNNIRQYLSGPVYIKPFETVEIVIPEEDKEGGSGANFLFEWAIKDTKNPPLFEAVMISTYGQQGLSFSTRGVPLYNE